MMPYVAVGFYLLCLFSNVINMSISPKQAVTASHQSQNQVPSHSSSLPLSVLGVTHLFSFDQGQHYCAAQGRYPAGSPENYSW